MNKIYQVFISSTYMDLIEARKKIQEVVLQAECIPSGMELFLATDSEQFEIIKQVIDYCDYYILIIGGKYGTLHADGISFTEKEYDYAVSKEIPVLAFIRDKIEDLDSDKKESDPKNVKKLNEFKSKVRDGRMVKEWVDENQLAGLVALSLNKAKTTHPRTGWIRANQTSKVEVLEQLNKLRDENDQLKIELNKNSETLEIDVNELAQGDDIIEIKGTFTAAGDYGTKTNWSRKYSWEKIFSLWGPFLFSPIEVNMAKIHLERILHEDTGTGGYDFYLNQNIFQTIKIQFHSLGLLNASPSNTVKHSVAEFLEITKKGKDYLMKIKSVKKIKSPT